MSKSHSRTLRHAPPKAPPASARVAALTGTPRSSSFGPVQPTLRLPLPLPSPSPTFDSPFSEHASSQAAALATAALPLVDEALSANAQSAPIAFTFGGTGRALSGQSGQLVQAGAASQRSVALPTPASNSSSASARHARAKSDPRPSVLDDAATERLLARALGDPSSSSSASSASSSSASFCADSDALLRDRKRLLSAPGVLGFRTPRAAVFEAVGSEPCLAAAIPSSAAAAVNVHNWMQAPKLPSPGKDLCSNRIISQS